MKNLLTIALLATLILSGCSSENKVESNIEISNEINQKDKDLQNFENEFYSFTYPSSFTTTNELNNKALFISSENSRIEIFKMEDFGDRPFGFSGEETQEDIDGYVPKEAFQKDGYDIWLFHPENDENSKEELMRILESISIK